MSESIENKMLIKMKKARRGSLFFISDFLSFGQEKTIAKSLDRLVEKKEIKRVARGIFVRPQQSKLLGELMPTTDEIAQAIARRDRARIIPTGSYSLHKLGLSTQVPMNTVYLTDGAARKIRIGSRTIVFKKTTPKNLAVIGEISSLVIQALKEIGKNKLEQWEEEIIIDYLKQEMPTKLQHDIRLAPEWIREIMKKAQ